jgi:hypothetical protein
MATDVSKEAVDFALRWTNAFPKPGPRQGVRADAVLAAFKVLVPLASLIVKLPLGTKKGGYPGAGYLTGSTITEKDVNEAKLVLAAVSTTLPAHGKNAVDPNTLGFLKAAGQWTLMVGTDLAADRTLLNAASDAWSAVGDSLVELPEVLWRAATEPWLLRAAWGEAKKEIGLAEIAVFGVLILGGGYIALKALGR